MEFNGQEISPNDLFRILTSQGWNSVGIIVTKNAPGGELQQVGVRWIQFSREEQAQVLKALAQKSQGETTAAIELAK